MFEYPLPVPVELGSDESGMSYSLRLASANGLSMRELLDLLRANGADDGAEKQERALSFLGGVSGAALLGLFPVRLGRKSGVEFQGHVFPLRCMLRSRRPQICPVCLARTGYCRKVWELSLSVVCLEHRCLLTDECPTCRRPLTWNRPSIEWGRCTHCLGRTRAAGDVSEHLFQFQQLVEHLFERRTAAGCLSSMPGEIQLSLGGWFAWAYAFGICERETGSVDRGVYTTIPTTREAVDLLERALARWSQFCSGPLDMRERLKLMVAEPPLLLLMAQLADSRDRSAGVAIYRSLFGQKSLSDVVRRLGVMEQLSLFG